MMMNGFTYPVVAPPVNDWAGVPASVMRDISRVHDGRCFALMAERRGHKPNRKHKRLWQHKPTCPACYKVEGHPSITQMPPNEFMDYALSDKENETSVPTRTSTVPSGSVVDRTASATSQSGASVHSIGMMHHPLPGPPRPAPVKAVPMPSVSTTSSATVAPVSKVVSGVMPSPYTAWPTAIPQPRIPTSQPVKPAVFPTAMVPMHNVAAHPPVKEAILPATASVPLEEAACTHESRCIAPSGIKLHLRLARACQPANWCLEQRPFTSCLENIAGVKMRGDESAPASVFDFPMMAMPTLNPMSFSTEPPHAYPRRTRKFSMDSTPSSVGLSDEDLMNPLVVDLELGPDGLLLGAETVLEASMLGKPSNSLAPFSGRKRRGDSLHLPLPQSLSAKSSDELDPTLEAMLLEEVLAASVTMDLQAAPVEGDSWLTSILIDFVALQFARKYPQVHFLPTNFMAYELKRALANAALGQVYVAKDLLNREVIIESDAIPPVVMPFNISNWSTPTAEKLPAASLPTAAMKPEAYASFSFTSSGLHRPVGAATNVSSFSGVSAPPTVAPLHAVSQLFPPPPGARIAVSTTQSLSSFSRSGLPPSIPLDAVMATAIPTASPAMPIPPFRTQIGAVAQPTAKPPNGYTNQRPSGYIPPKYESVNKPLIFFWNIGNMHWNLVRVNTGARKDIEVFEPMGKLTSRANVHYKSEGLSLRSVPRDLISWLDDICPLSTAGGWKSRTVAAITSQQQGNGFDCGVACLLYAEKCGQGFEKEDIMESTDQDQITQYRQLLTVYFQKQLERVRLRNSVLDLT